MEMLLRNLWAAVSLIAKDGFGGEFGESNEAMSFVFVSQGKCECKYCKKGFVHASVIWFN